jgi:transposase
MPMYSKMRAVYTGEIMAGKSMSAARKRSGLSRHCHARIQKKLRETGSLNDKPRSGGPKKYTDEVLEACYAIMIKEEPPQKWNMTSLFKHLKASGVIHAEASKSKFFKKFKKWGHEQELHIQFQSTKEEFKVLARDRAPRKAYAEKMLAMIDDHPNLEFVFIDETTLEHGPHPKKGDEQ